MKIDFLTNDGSPLGVTPKSIWGDGKRVGVGGSELAMLTMCELWGNRGDEVTLYNNPDEQVESSFKQLPIEAFEPRDERDILIIFRSPNHRIRNAKGKKIWWSCDQYTIGDFRQFSHQVDEIVCISPFHEKHFQSAYGIQNAHVIDIPVRLDDFEREDVQAEKVSGRCIFTSVPDRGLYELSQIWNNLVMAFPHLSLSITSDYRLWNVPNANNAQHRMNFLGKKNVHFLGALPRNEYLKELNRAEYLIYPCNYDELFCVSVAEAQVAGVWPITTEKGALATTNMGTFAPMGDVRQFYNVVKQVIGDVGHKGFWSEELARNTRERFSPEKALTNWDEVFNA